MKNLILFLLLAALGCSSVPLRSKKEDIPFIGSMTVSRYRLINGLNVLILKDKTSPTFAYQTWFNVGSKDEKVKYTGLAHLFEHMMFKQTKNLKPGEYDKTIERSGGKEINAFTSRDYTAYIQELPKSELELIIRLEAERMKNLIVDDAAFKTEVGVVQNERMLRNENSPSGMMYQKLYETAYKKNNYRWPVIGYQEDLERMTSDDARKFYEDYYTPERATIVIVGDVDPDKTIELIYKYYGNHSNRRIERVPNEPEPEQTSARRVTLKLNVQGEELIMAYHVPMANHKDSPAIEVVQAVLSDGQSSRLQKSLVDAGISTNVSSGSFIHKDPGLFMISTSLQKGKTSTIAESIILKEIERLSKESISLAELKRAKNLVRFAHYSGLESNGSMARYLGNSELVFGTFEAALSVQEKIKSVSAEELKMVINKYFNPNNRVIIRGVPKS